MRYRVAAINYLISTFRGSHFIVDAEIWAVVGSFIAQEACFICAESETRRYLVETGGWVQCPTILACSRAGREVRKTRADILIRQAYTASLVHLLSSAILFACCRFDSCDAKNEFGASRLFCYNDTNISLATFFNS